MADGFARATNKPQYEHSRSESSFSHCAQREHRCVIVHVDVGTSGLGAAMHNASTGKAPVLVFAGLSPYTLEVS